MSASIAIPPESDAEYQRLTAKLARLEETLRPVQPLSQALQTMRVIHEVGMRRAARWSELTGGSAS